MTRTAARRSAYVEAIGKSFLDVPWGERQVLLDDVATHLDAAGLPPDEVGPWIERFGPASHYARGVRESLGMATDTASMVNARRFRLRFARRRTKLVIAVAIVVDLAIVLGLVWVTNVQPFILADLAYCCDAESISADGHDEYRWTWAEGDRFEIGTWMRNDGPLPVRVTAIPLPDPRFVPWDRWRVALARGERNLEPGRPFEPFTLDPGEGRLIWFRGDFLECPEDYDAGTIAGISQFDITFDVLGITRHETVDLGFTYSVEIPESGC